MAYRSASAPFSLGEASIDVASKTSAFFDFSMPIVRADSWTTTSDDLVELRVANLVAKERRLMLLLNQTVAAQAGTGSTPSNALLEAMDTFRAHGVALAALYPAYVSPLASTTDRIRLGIVNACCALVAKLVSYRSSYSAKLDELYAAASEISIAYVALQATALSLGDRCAAAVAARHLRHVGQLLLTLHELVPYEVVRELQMRGLDAVSDNLWEVAGMPAMR